MNAEEFNEETRRERIEEERMARTLEDEIEDRESDIRDLHKVVEEYVQRVARQTEALMSLRSRLRFANARNEAQQDELDRLRAEHDAGTSIVRQLQAKRPMIDPEFVLWMDAHDRTELAK